MDELKQTWTSRERDMTQEKYARPDNATIAAWKAFWTKDSDFGSAVVWGTALVIGLLALLGHTIGWF
jgi:hypothetical protein